MPADDEDGAVTYAEDSGRILCLDQLSRWANENGFMEPLRSSAVLLESRPGPKAENQDYVFGFRVGKILIAGVLDGVSSTPGASRAAQIGGEAFARWCLGTLSTIKNVKLTNLVTGGFTQAAIAIATDSVLHADAATTLSAVAVDYTNREVRVLSIGDTPVLLIDQTRSQTICCSRLHKSPSDSLTHFISRAGVVGGPEVKSFRLSRSLNANIVLCSDGFYELFSGQCMSRLSIELSKYPRRTRTKSVLNEVCEAIQDKGIAVDNYSVAVLRLPCPVEVPDEHQPQIQGRDR
ncbi:MAG: protein phosphatase 2C domain-containing protein [Phycisphaeraceae bacterium]|nr:protein phosphatase 2C domain-containing protein [Phycisphaeraceae bacterium]